MPRWSFVPALALACAGAGCTPAVPVQVAPAAPPTSGAQAAERPIPYPVVPPEGYRAAVESGTRTTRGVPGPRYWQNFADYRIRSRLFPDTRRLEGSVSIRYHNNSPDTLETLVLDLTQNFHAPGAERLEPGEVTGGMELKRVAVAGRDLTADATSGPRYQVSGTKLAVAPPTPVLPGTTVELAIDYAFGIAKQGASGRMGWDERNLFFLAYFYPQMAAYDDVVGWDPDQFLGPGEFYNDFGNYEVTIEAPAGWVVVGTGTLQNPAEVLAAPVRERLRAAESSDTVVHVLTAADFNRATLPGSGGILRWSFRADTVRDVAFSLTRQSLWDAARTPVGDRDGDGTVDYARVDALYRESAPRWRNAARYAQTSIRFLSEYTGYPYPWPHMSAVEGEGIIGGGMEYPMMTLIGSYTQANDQALFGVVAHELAHMWVPMIVNTDERRYGWMDEGITNFNEAQARRAMYPGSRPEIEDREAYLRVAEAGMEGEMMRWSNYHYPGPAFVIASYYKPEAVMVALRGLLGEETFNRAYREFIRRWAFKHAYPWDLWNTFEDVSGRDLDWFWRTWYYETWTLDQAVRSVTSTGSGTDILVEDRGLAPMPARLTITRADGEVLHREVPVERWLQGARTATVSVPAGSPVTRVEIDAENVFPDVDRGNNVWTR